MLGCGAVKFAQVVTFGLIGMFVGTQALFAQPGRKQLLEGNKLYEQEKYDEALVQYQDALVQSPNNPYAYFDIGNAHYRKNKFEDALKAYEKATTFEDPILRAQAYYNMGNALYRLGKLPEAILAYKKALELNPNDEDAKYNLEYVRAKLKQESQKQQASPEQQQEQQRQNQQGGQDQQEQKQQQQEQQSQEQQQQPSQQSQQSEQEQKQAQQQQMQQRQLSKEEAERLLDALNDQEEKLLKAQRVRGGAARRAKDW